MRHFFVVCVLATSLLARADIVTCACDPAHPETLMARECGLCREAEKQPLTTEVFLLKDANPTKPNRWLALPRAHERSIDLLSLELRTKLFTAAVEKGKQLFGESWAIAYNAPQMQTQCHVHVHIGRLLAGVETQQFVTVAKIADIPAPPPGEGFWIHPQGSGFHVHTGELITETVLLR